VLDNTSPLNNVLKWTACAFVCAGAFCTSFMFDPLNIYFLNVGAVLYLIWAYRIRELNQIVVNIVLLGVYIMGFVQRM
jgi:4-hydroxybenzoate polyprenyltransferase